MSNKTYYPDDKFETKFLFASEGLHILFVDDNAINVYDLDNKEYVHVDNNGYLELEEPQIGSLIAYESNGNTMIMEITGVRDE